MVHQDSENSNSKLLTTANTDKVAGIESQAGVIFDPLVDEDYSTVEGYNDVTTLDAESSSATELHPSNKQLHIFGYSIKEKVYVRLLKKNAKAIKKCYEYPLSEKNISELNSSNNSGFGVYFVVNGYGDTDKDVKVCRCCFYEHDDRDHNSQINSYSEFGLPETTKITTGGKSIHHYWVLKHPVAPDVWTTFQSDLIALVQSDPRIKNPSRVMRLAGFKHQKDGGISEIISVGEPIEFETLRALVPTSDTGTKPKAKTSEKKSEAESSGEEINIFEAAVLEECTKDYDYPPISLFQLIPISQREVAKNGIVEGGRNASGCALARNLIGARSWCKANDVHYLDDAREIFDKFRDRCSPPLDIDEADDIWRKQEKANPEPGLTHDYLENIKSSWVKRHKQQDIYVGNHPRENEILKKLLTSVDEKEIRSIVSDIIDNFDDISAERTLVRFLLNTNKEKGDEVIKHYLAVSGVGILSGKKLEQQCTSFANYILDKFVNFCRHNQLYEYFGSCKGYWFRQCLLNKNVVLHDLWQILKVTHGSLRFNTFKCEIELESEKIQLSDNVYHQLLFGKLPCDVRGRRESVEDTFISVAKLNKYNPVADYFKECYKMHGYTGIHQDFASKTLGVSEEQYKRFFEVFALGVIHRTFTPGCVFKIMLILFSSSQHIGKSTLFKTLLPDKSWFCEDFHDFANKDHLSKLNRYVILEIPEVDKIFKSRDRSALKSGVSQTHDDYREPYARISESHPRCSVLVGTTNEREFLNDPTGSVRFPIIEIPDGVTIDLDFVRENRDKMWADFYHLAMVEGKQPKLESDELAAMQENNLEYQQIDPWYQPISDYLTWGSAILENKAAEPVPCTETTIDAIFSNALHIEVANRDQKSMNRVADILRLLGWDKRVSKKRIKDPSAPKKTRQVNVWEKK